MKKFSHRLLIGLTSIAAFLLLTGCSTQMRNGLQPEKDEPQKDQAQTEQPEQEEMQKGYEQQEAQKEQDRKDVSKALEDSSDSFAATDWKRFDVSQTDLINEFKYTDTLFADLGKGSWVTSSGDPYADQKTYKYMMVNADKSTQPVAEITTKSLIVTGPHIDRTNNKIYLQLSEVNPTTHEVKGIHNVFLNYKSGKIETDDSQSFITANGQMNIIETIDNQGNVYLREVDPFESICSISAKNELYESGTYKFNALPTYSEQSNVDCVGVVEAKITSKGKELVTVTPDSERKNLILSVNSKTDQKTVKIPIAEIGAQDHYSDLPAGGIFLSDDLSKGIFKYFNHAVIFSLQTGEFKTIEDSALYQEATNNGTYGWKGDDFYIYDPKADQTFKFTYLSDQFEILSGQKIPADSSNPLNYIKKHRSCERERATSCFENSLTENGVWNELAY